MKSRNKTQPQRNSARELTIIFDGDTCHVSLLPKLPIPRQHDWCNPRPSQVIVCQVEHPREGTLNRVDAYAVMTSMLKHPKSCVKATEGAQSKGGVMFALDLDYEPSITQESKLGSEQHFFCHKVPIYFTDSKRKHFFLRSDNSLWRPNNKTSWCKSAP